LVLINIYLVLSQTPANTVRPWIQGSASHGVPVYSPLCLLLTAPTHGGMARLSWPVWWDGLSALRGYPSWC